MDKKLREILVRHRLGEDGLGNRCQCGKWRNDVGNCLAVWEGWLQHIEEVYEREAGEQKVLTADEIIEKCAQIAHVCWGNHRHEYCPCISIRTLKGTLAVYEREKETRLVKPFSSCKISRVLADEAALKPFDGNKSPERKHAR